MLKEFLYVEHNDANWRYGYTKKEWRLLEADK
jgi:hypothetical protein